MRLGVFGGTFDPPHHGHLVMAADVHRGLGLDRVVFVPSGEPPHKRGMHRTPAEQRLDMVRAAIRGDDRFEVDDLEVRREGPSYTVDTLREFRRRHPAAALFFLLGSDMLRDFPGWREPEQIAELATLVLMERAGDVPDADGRWPLVKVPVTRIDISSTGLRRRAAAGESIRYYVPERVREIVEREALYVDRECGAAGARSPADEW